MTTPDTTGHSPLSPRRLSSRTVERYLEALAWVAEMRDPLQGRAYSDTRSADRGSVTPNPVAGWAEDLTRRELRFLRDRAVFLEEWMDKPRPLRHSRARRACECGRGIHRGAQYCSGCGKAVA